MYKPKEEEFVELGFRQEPTYSSRRFVKDTKYDQIRCEIYEHPEDEDREPEYDWEINVNWSGGAWVIFHPSSRQDVETLIRMLT